MIDEDLLNYNTDEHITEENEKIKVNKYKLLREKVRANKTTSD